MADPPRRDAIEGSDGRGLATLVSFADEEVEALLGRALQSLHRISAGRSPTVRPLEPRWHGRS